MTNEEKIFQAFTADEIEVEYNVRLGRPDYETTVMPDWRDRSAAARARLAGRLDLAYGPSDRQRIDLFGTGAGPAPTLIYLHGGYWQRGDKALYSFLAEPFVRQGIAVAVVGYDLCPAVSITRITEEVRDAIIWLWREAGDLGLDQARIAVMGHSAGGHLTGMVMGTDWTALAPDLPLDLVKAGIPISPLNELEPLRFTSINDQVAMDAAEARAQSPMNHPPLTDAPQLVITGGTESAEFQRQADIYAAAFGTASRDIARHIVPGCDHFDEINALADDKNEAFGKVITLLSSM